MYNFSELNKLFIRPPISGVVRGARGAMAPQTFGKLFFCNELMLLRYLNLKCKKMSRN